ncbi:MAG: BatA domain-containing protein [Bacteroidales bacterium]|nr:BatA domain-containing protein [Bacteroidales bacterium]
MLFSSPAFLWALLAVVIPVVVHLFHFRRYKKVYFSNVVRLAELQSESRRRSTLRELLVMAMRILAIVFLVLAFARPVIPGHNSRLQSGSTAVSIYIDNSFSMENASSDGSQLETAKQKVREIAAAYGPGDSYQLLTNDMVGGEFRWLSREELLDAVDAVKISPVSRRLSEVMQRQSSFYRNSGAANRLAYVISDFQTSMCDFTAVEVDSTVQYTMVPLSQVAADNLYVDTVKLDAPAYFVGGHVTAEVVVHNSGTREVEKVPVKLYIDGRERAMATLDLPAGASGTAQLKFSIDGSGWLDGRVEIVDYPVVFDDEYYFTLHVDERVSVLEVDQSQPNAALRKLFAADSAVSFRNVTLPRLDLSSLSDYNFIILNELSGIGTGVAQELATWVNEGGSLMVLPDANGRTEGLNELLSAMQSPRVGTWMAKQVKASRIDYDSRLYRNVFSGQSDEMEMPSAMGRYQIDGSQSVRQSIITFVDGGDMLSATPFGEGYIYLFAMPLNEQWTDLVNQALFVPTVYNMALFSRPIPPAAYTIGGSAPVVLQTSVDAMDEQHVPLLSDNADFSVMPDVRRVGNRLMLLQHGELQHAGIYLLGEEHLAFNYNRIESQLDFLGRDDVAQQSGCTVLANADKPIDEEIRAMNDGRQLWRWCVLLALLALAAEVIILRKR